MATVEMDELEHNQATCPRCREQQLRLEAGVLSDFELLDAVAVAS
jgi:hypothetical protein